jgi:hypothetical protein
LIRFIPPGFDDSSSGFKAHYTFDFDDGKIIQNDSKALITCFSDEVIVNIAGMRFKGSEEVAAFAERDIWGGKYKVEKNFKQGNKEIVYCLFWPKGWQSPEPPIEYQFQIREGKLAGWIGKYR